MGISYQFACDGCAKKAQAEDASLPTGWVFADVGVAFRNEDHERIPDREGVHVHSLLCRNCQHVLLDRIDPKRWPRAAEPVDYAHAAGIAL